MHAMYTHMLVLSTINQKQTSKLALGPMVDGRITHLLGYTTSRPIECHRNEFRNEIAFLHF